ncbi:hypothetical protein SAPIO_CDS9485 [Scedosporium apiospermum]|uniref:Rhodopsin domain-containing protein n=1 Tax=Pseudallescheria apiosperma TaxID=563466 RepID=A0A084FWW7_PSEDA|nr:uncharacterized protein SAPIO_CDS9485 [Scedosporium apiospermum]KEZ39579.1 hypothetical protein SAPIO_CDS9485 [Scedosporium apiospermum]
MDEFPPEYVNASNAGRIVGVVGVFHIIAFAFVSLRVYVRLFMVKAFGIDDTLIIISALLALASWICLILQIPYGLGRHGMVVPVEDRIKFEKITFWKTVISDGFALGFVVAYSIQAITWLFVYCTPYSGWWEFQWMNPFDPRCHDFNVFVNLVYWNISCHIFTDVCLGALPVPIIWTLKMKLRVRIYVIAILNLGYFAVLMGILKAVFMLTTGGDPDAIFDYWVHFWQNLQLNIGIIAACASFLKPLVGRFLKINSSVGYYPSYDRYGQRGHSRTGLSVPGTNSKRTGTIDRSLGDDFDAPSKYNIRIAGEEISPGSTSVQGTRAHVASVGNSSTEAIYIGGQPSDSNSEEIILQNLDKDRGIMLTRDFTVKYSDK